MTLPSRSGGQPFRRDRSGRMPPAALSRPSRALRPPAARSTPPAILQLLFVTLYAGLWVLGWVDIPGIGRPEKLVVAMGLLVVPFAVGWRRRVPRGIVMVGVVGLLGTYTLSFLINGPTRDGLGFVLSLTARIVFLWVSFVLLQNAIVLGKAVRLLILSSMVAAVVAFVISVMYGVGIAREEPLRLQAMLDPYTFSTFASSQLATMGAILLLGVAATMTSTASRVGLTILALAICGAAYISYFRREHLLGVPLVLLTLTLTGGGVRGRRSVAGVLALAGFLGVVTWDYTRDNSIFRSRMESEFGGGFVDPLETRVTNLQAAIEAVRIQPGLGFGAGRHAEAISPYVRMSAETFLGGFNIFAWLAVEGGLGCALSYLLILLGVLHVAWRWRRLTGTESYALVLRCAPAMAIQILIWGIFGNAWDLPLGWFMLGMILASAQLAEGAHPAGVTPERLGSGPRYRTQPPALVHHWRPRG